MNIPAGLRYTDQHEWAKEDGVYVWVGISDYAQGQLGDVVFVDLPATGKRYKQHDVFGTIEAVKAAADLYCPVSGEIVEINKLLGEQPDTINKDPYDAGWMVKIKMDDASELTGLMDATAYEKHVGNA
jgi:glycine cleavage system H protein